VARRARFGIALCGDQSLRLVIKESSLRDRKRRGEIFRALTLEDALTKAREWAAMLPN